MINPASKGGLWFAYSHNNPAFNHVFDSVGGGRFISNNVGAGQSLVFADASTGWVIDIVQQDGANNGQILRGNTVETTGTFSNQGLQTGGSYLIGGQNGFGQDDPRNLAEIILDLNFDSAPTIANVVSYLLGTIPP